jgi:urocanate hydratase
MTWDVMCGVSRRAWGRCENAVEVSAEFNRNNPNYHITLPYIADEDKVKKAVAALF